jgi:hypothetical protein
MTTAAQAAVDRVNAGDSRSQRVVRGMMRQHTTHQGI